MSSAGVRGSGSEVQDVKHACALTAQVDHCILNSEYYIWAAPLSIATVADPAGGRWPMRIDASALTQPIKPYLFIPGLGLAGLMLSGYALIAVDWVLRQKHGWMRIAVGVLGSWIAAIGILVLAASAKTLLAS